MSTAGDKHPHENPFRGFDESVEHALGADMLNEPDDRADNDATA